MAVAETRPSAQPMGPAAELLEETSGDALSAAAASAATLGEPEPRRFRAARELLASAPARRRAKPAPARPASKGTDPTVVEGAQLEHLMCFISNSRLHSEVQTMEDVSCRQDLETRDVNLARSEEVMRLSLEAAVLRQRLCGPTKDLLLEGKAPPSGVQAHSDCKEVFEMERQALRRQAAKLDRELEEVRQRAREAQEEVARARAKREALAEAHRQEVEELQRPPAASLRQQCERLRREGSQLLERIQEHGSPGAVYQDSAVSLAQWVADFARCLDAASAPGVEAESTTGAAGACFVDLAEPVAPLLDGGGAPPWGPEVAC